MAGTKPVTSILNNLSAWYDGPCIVEQYWTISGLARLREGVLTHTMLTHTMLTHTVFAVGVLWPALAHGACGGPAPSAAAGPKGLQQPARRETPPTRPPRVSLVFVLFF